MHIVKLLPEFMKLDLSLTRGVDAGPVKQALTAALVGFASQIGAHLIAEGVETAQELTTLVELGVECAQGYYLGAPAPLPLRGGVPKPYVSAVEAAPRYSAVAMTSPRPVVGQRSKGHAA